MMLNKLILLLSISAIILSCKKDKIDLPESTDPVFNANGTLGAETFNIIAGDNDAFMYTMTDVVNAVEVVSGKLSQNDFGIELGIYDGFIDFTNISFTDGMSLNPTFSKEYTSPLLNFSKSMFTNAIHIQSIEWSLDGVFQGVDSFSVYEPGKYEVCANITFNDGSSRSVCNDVIVGYQRAINDPIEYYYDDIAGVANLWVSNTGTAFQNVEWYVDGILSSDIDNDIIIPISGSGLKEVKAIIHYANNVTKTKVMLLDGGFSHFKTIEDLTLIENSGVNVIQDFNIHIKVEKNGVEFDSERADNSSSNVQINSIEYFSLNAAGNKVYKINANVNCFVKNSMGGPVIPLSFTTNFGFEIK